MLRIFFDFISDTIYKCNKFLKTLSKKGFEFFLYNKNNLILLYLSFILLLIEINSITKKQYYKKDIFIASCNDCIKIIFILLTKIIILYIQISVI